MPKIIKSKKRKTRKPRKPKKPKIRIGKDLKKDDVGTNQLLEENRINNIIQSENIIYDKKIYKQYKQNINEQKTKQVHGGDPIINIELKKKSHILYNKMVDSIFNGNDETITPKPKPKPKPKPTPKPKPKPKPKPTPKPTQFKVKVAKPKKPKTTATQHEQHKILKTKDLDDFLELKAKEKKYSTKAPSNATIAKWKKQFQSLVDTDYYFQDSPGNFEEYVKDAFPFHY
jgi:hypothetical protein